MVNDHRACLKHVEGDVFTYTDLKGLKYCEPPPETKALAKHCGFEDWVLPFIALLQLLHRLMYTYRHTI